MVTRKKKYLTEYPHLLEEWDYDRNDPNPKILTHGSARRVWWICNKCKYKWNMSIYRRINGNNCIICNGTETKNHKNGKRFIYNKLKTINRTVLNNCATIEIEHFYKNEHGWRTADVFFEYKGNKYVFEYQHSDIDYSTLKMRSDFWKKANHNMIWIFDKRFTQGKGVIRQLMEEKQDIFKFDIDSGIFYRNDTIYNFDNFIKESILTNNFF